MVLVATCAPFNVVAVANYQARSNAEMSLVLGQTYTVVATDGADVWWQSKDVNGNLGWFPAAYTAPQGSPQSLPPPPPTPRVATINVTVTTPASAPLSSNQVPIKVPQPSKPPQLEKNPTAAYLKLQIIEAKGLTGDVNKMEATTFVYRRRVLDGTLGDEIFKTSTVKRSLIPKWNEAFQLNSLDAENEIVSIRVCNGKKCKSKGKEYLGEVNIPLRQAVRDFDAPASQLKWFPLKGNDFVPDSQITGSVLLFIQFVDTRQSRGPSDFRHTSHIGYQTDGSFSVNNIPKEWERLFVKVGISKSDLSRNESFAKQVFDIMAHHPEAQTAPQLPPSPPQFSSSSSRHHQVPNFSSNFYYTQDDADSESWSDSSSSLPPPPPPPPSTTYSTDYSQHQTQAFIEVKCEVSLATSAPPPPPPPPKRFLDGPSRSNLNRDIQRGASLRPVQIAHQSRVNPKYEMSLEDDLRKALNYIRSDIHGRDTNSDEELDEWD